MHRGLSVDDAAQHCPHRSRWYCNVCSDQTDLWFMQYFEVSSEFHANATHWTVRVMTQGESMSGRTGNKCETESIQIRCKWCKKDLNLGWTLVTFTHRWGRSSALTPSEVTVDRETAEAWEVFLGGAQSQFTDSKRLKWISYLDYSYFIYCLQLPTKSSWNSVRTIRPRTRHFLLVFNCSTPKVAGMPFF